MNIRIEKISKRYRFDWIFKNVTYTFESGQRYALLGPNGSGKSTLLKVLSGHLSPSKGTIEFVSERDGKPIDGDQIYRFVSYAAPYIELIEEYTLEEAIRFHAAMRPLLPGVTPEKIEQILALSKAKHKEIRFFSSGMKQRLKLALAVCSDTPVLLLDEPATNLDTQGIEWYKQLLCDFAAKRLVVIASNDPHDAAFCPNHLQIMDYK
jgi:ABC-type multidrug transport system ATPase subunit